MTLIEKQTHLETVYSVTMMGLIESIIVYESTKENRPRTQEIAIGYPLPRKLTPERQRGHRLVS